MQVDTSDAVRRVRAGEKPGKPKKKKPKEETTDKEKKKDRSPEKNVSRDRDKENKVQKENKKNSQSPNKTPNKVSNKSPTKTPTKRSPKASPKAPKRKSPSPTPDIMAGLTNGTNGIDSDNGIHLPDAESEAVLAEKDEVTIDQLKFKHTSYISPLYFTSVFYLVSFVTSLAFSNISSSPYFLGHDWTPIIGVMMIVTFLTMIMIMMIL